MVTWSTMALKTAPTVGLSVEMITSFTVTLFWSLFCQLLKQFGRPSLPPIWKIAQLVGWIALCHKAHLFNPNHIDNWRYPWTPEYRNHSLVGKKPPCKIQFVDSFVWKFTNDQSWSRGSLYRFKPQMVGGKSWCDRWPHRCGLKQTCTSFS